MTSPALLCASVFLLLGSLPGAWFEVGRKTANGSGGTYFNYITETNEGKPAQPAKGISRLILHNTLPNSISVFNGPSKEASFSWSTCGNDSVTIHSLSVVQGMDLTFQIDLSGQVGAEINPPVKGSLKLSKKMFWGWTSLPCLDDFGSCDYLDLCSLTPFTPDSCPTPWKDQNLPCTCPIKQGSYNASFRFDLSKVKLPRWLERGHYKATANFGEDPQLLCLQIDITVV